MNTSASKYYGSSFVNAIFRDRVTTPFVLLVGLIILGAIINPGFFSFLQMMNILQASFFLGLVALGQTILAISGREGLDLSVGGMLTVGTVCRGRHRKR